MSTTKPMIFKIGPLTEQIIEKKDNYYPNGICYVVLAYIKVGNFQTFFDLDDPEKEIDRSKLSYLNEKECFFIHKKNNDEFNTDNNYLNKNLDYYFVNTNENLVKPDCLIAFKYDNNNDGICSSCKTVNSSLKYCLNDKLYLCLKCDEEIHNPSISFNTVKKHKRIYIDFTIFHDNICTLNDHDKPYEVYCTECDELFCITCLGTEVHNFAHVNKKQSIVYINNVGFLDKIIMEQNLVK